MDVTPMSHGYRDADWQRGVIEWQPDDGSAGVRCGPLPYGATYTVDDEGGPVEVDITIDMARNDRGEARVGVKSLVVKVGEGSFLSQRAVSRLPIRGLILWTTGCASKRIGGGKVSTTMQEALVKPYAPAGRRRQSAEHDRRVLDLAAKARADGRPVGKAVAVAFDRRPDRAGQAWGRQQVKRATDRLGEPSGAIGSPLGSPAPAPGSSPDPGSG